MVSACAGGAILTGWAIHLQASALLTGLVVALPQMAQLFQLPAAWSTALFGRRRAAVALVAGVAPGDAAAGGLAAARAVRSAPGRRVLLAVAALSAVLGVLGNNAWVSWMGDLVPRRIRGRYFGRRIALCTIAGATASAAAGWRSTGRGRTARRARCWPCCSSFASAGGVVTTVLMLRQHDPAPRAPSRTPSRSRPRCARCAIGRRAACSSTCSRGTWRSASPGGFFALYMLQNLRMGFTLVALHGIGLAAARVLTAPLWGRVIDRLGARPVLVACAFGISAIPLVLAVPDADVPVAVASSTRVLAGVLWGGHNLAMFVVPMTATPERGRPFYIAAIAMDGRPRLQRSPPPAAASWPRRCRGS